MGAIKMIIKQDELNVIKFDGIEVRIITQLGEPWFIAIDVANALEINNHRQALTILDSDEKNTVSLNDGNRGNPNHTIISESGFYKLISRSRKATTAGTFAHRFSNWIFREVIPTIRKTGAYGVPWAFLHDHTNRMSAYDRESSKRGRNLEACKKWKANLIAEEKALWKKYQPELALV